MIMKLESGVYSRFLKKVESLNKRSRKFNLPDIITVTEIRRFRENIKITIDKIKVGVFYRTVNVELVEFNLAGTPPKINGWTFFGKVALEKTESGNHRNILFEIPDRTIPEKYRSSGNDCEHCGHNRQRKHVFILGHDDGRFMQVGRSCLKDFIGHGSPEVIADMMDSAMKYIVDWEFSEFEKGNESYDLGLEHYMTCVCAAVREGGRFITKKECRESCSGCGYTADDALGIVVNPVDKELGIYRTTESDNSKAKEILEWFSGYDSDSNFIYNLKTIVNRGYVQEHELSMFAALYSVWERSGKQTSTFKKGPVVVNEFCGQIGNKIEKTGKFLKSIQYESQFGIGFIYKFMDADGYIFVWFTSCMLQEMEYGDNVSFSGKIKDHKHYGTEKQTVLTRCKVSKVEQMTF